MCKLRVKKGLCFLLCLLFVLAMAAGCAKNKKGNEGGGTSSTEDAKLSQSRSRDFRDYIVCRDESHDSPGTVVGTSLMYYTESSKVIFQVDADLTTTISAGEITDEIKMYTDDGSIYIRAINTSAEECALSDCIICSARLDENSGLYSLDENMVIGKNTYDEIYNFYSEHNLFREEEDCLLYKINDAYIDRGYKGVLPGTKEVDGIYRFEDGILKSVSLEAPGYLYYELNKNADAHELELMGQAEIDRITQERNQILSDLEKAFAQAGVDVVIDKDTGLIAMNNDVLFDTDSSALKENAKDYIDSFFTVYTSVLFNPDMKTEFQTVKFVGHTDTSGDYDYNKTLSTNRAQSVLDYCLGESSIDESVKSKMSAIASAEGKSFDEPIYNDAGEVDMAASRRVEINFVIKTDYTKEADEGEAANAEASKTARGTLVNNVMNQYDVDEYGDVSANKLKTFSAPVALPGDYVWVRPGAPNLPEKYDQHDAQFTIEDSSVGNIEGEGYDDIETLANVVNYFFKANKPGTTKVSVYCKGGMPDGTDLNQYAYFRVFEERDDYPLSLVPNKDKVVLTKSGDDVNIKLTLCGDYSGDVWAFVYGKEAYYSGNEASWIDPTTLSVDIGYPIKSDCVVSVILTPANDLDTCLGYYRIPVEYVDEK